MGQRVRRILGAGGGQTGRPALRDDLAAAGWVLPVGFADPGAATATRVGTIDTSSRVEVDPRGVVSVLDRHIAWWSLDWWIGADDRWHFPSTDSGVRQRLVDGVPVVETKLRIPGGDAIQHVYGVRAPGSGEADGYVVVEVYNDTPVPFALALVVRPFSASGDVSGLAGIYLEATRGGRGPDEAQAVMSDRQPLLLLPRRPARAAGACDGSDVAELVSSGAAALSLDDAAGGRRRGTRSRGGSEPGSVHPPTAALLFPVPHRTSLRVLLPLGGAEGAIPHYPAAVPDRASVAGGWIAHIRRGVRVEVPDTGLAEGIKASRAALLLAATNAGGPAESASLVAALDREGFHDEASSILRRWHDQPGRLPEGRAGSIAALGAIVDHWRLARDPEVAELLLPLTAVLARSARPRRKSPSRANHSARAVGLVAYAEMLRGLGQPAAAELAAGEAQAAMSTVESTMASDEDGSGAWRALRETVGAASPTWAWPDGRPGPATFLGQMRSVLVASHADGLDLLPAGFGAWWGLEVELHDAPTPFGRISFAVRWHGDRPALLWQMEPHDGVGQIELTASRVAPAWLSGELRGEDLLSAVPPRAAGDPHRRTTTARSGGKAEAVAPRSVLPLAPRSEKARLSGDEEVDQGEVAHSPVGERETEGSPFTVDRPDASGESFS